MDNTTELDEFDRNRNEVRVYAALYIRKGQWTTLEWAAIRSGLSLADATSALWRMKNQEVLEWKWRGPAGVFCLPRRGTDSCRAELEFEARRLRLIKGPRMKPLFSAPTRSLSEPGIGHQAKEESEANGGSQSENE